VHHGGAGTTTAGLKAAVSALFTPYFNVNSFFSLKRNRELLIIILRRRKRVNSYKPQAQ
jgi:hypothetical protein